MWKRMPDWQTSLPAAVVLERDRAGQARHVRIETSHGTAIVRFYRESVSIRWHQTEGDAAHFAGAWRFAATGGGVTRATYNVELDFGSAWGLLVAGPIKARLRERFIDAADLVRRMPLRLRDHVEVLVIGEGEPPSAAVPAA
jgi:polyketide cyclase/dehydrase/lipid transport protein